MLTYGYIREATQAHLDLDESEIQAMNLQARYHIFANEAMQAICAVKPKYEYFKVKIVEEYLPIINLGDNVFRAATEEELEWVARGLSEPNFADATDMTKWYEAQHTYLMGAQVGMPEDFIAFANKQAWAFVINTTFNSEVFVNSELVPNQTPTRIPATKNMFMYTGSNSLTFLQEGEFWVPYKGIWYRFLSSTADTTVINVPVDVLSTIPMYIASQCLQMDHARKASAKRAEFELALARVSSSDFLISKYITPSFK